MYVPKRIVMITIYLLLIFLTTSQGKNFISNKREQVGSAEFKTMMRYGRGGNTDNDKDTKVNVHSRAGAFFLGPRYGKRMNSNSPLYYTMCDSDDDLTCSYTGFTDLYRCSPRKDNLGQQLVSSE